MENVTAGYGDTVVLRDVSLSVPDSKVVALLGPNGAGKTTLFRVASGVIKPMSGRVRLNGEDVTGKRPFYMARRGLCNLPEGRGIFPSLDGPGQPHPAITQGQGERHHRQGGGSLSGADQPHEAVGRQPERRRTADAGSGAHVRL